MTDLTEDRVGERNAERAARPYTVIYDGTCSICTRSVELLRRWDRDGLLEIVRSQDDAVRARFPWIAEGDYADSLQVIGPGGRTWQRGAAIEQLIAVLPRGPLFTWMFRIPFARRIADRTYRWVARNRYRLGCGDHCEVPRA
jgi:predicted DCC family thiol-disulfide oxidoreductase YuxK